MSFREEIKAKIPRSSKIVFPEGSDARIIQAAIALSKENLVVPVLLGDAGEIDSVSKAEGLDASGIEILTPGETGYENQFAEEYVRLRSSDKRRLDTEAGLKMILKPISVNISESAPGGSTYCLFLLTEI